MLCYASLAYKMTWRPSHRYCKEAKIRMVSLNMLFNCHTLTSLSLHIPVLSSGLNWIPPIVNQLVAIKYKKTKNSGVLRSRGQDSGWKQKGGGHNNRLHVWQRQCSQNDFWVVFLFLFLRKFHKFHKFQAGSTGPLQLRGVFYFCKNWHLFFIFCNQTYPDLVF